MIEKQYQYLFNTCEGLTKFKSGWLAKGGKKNKKKQETTEIEIQLSRTDTAFDLSNTIDFSLLITHLIVLLWVSHTDGNCIQCLLSFLCDLAATVAVLLDETCLFQLFQSIANNTTARFVKVVGAGSSSLLATECAGKLANTTGFQVDLASNSSTACVKPIIIQRTVLFVRGGLGEGSVIRGGNSLRLLQEVGKCGNKCLAAHVADASTFSHNFFVRHAYRNVRGTFCIWVEDEIGN